MPLKHQLSLELLPSCRDFLHQRLQKIYNIIIFSYCIFGTGGTHRSSDYFMKFYFTATKKKLADATQLPLFTSKNGLFEPARSHPIHHYCIPTTLVVPQSPLFVAMMIGSDTEGQQTRSPVWFLALIPAGNSNWIFDFESVLRNGLLLLYDLVQLLLTWSLGHKLPEAAAVLGARHRQLPTPPPYQPSQLQDLSLDGSRLAVACW